MGCVLWWLRFSGIWRCTDFLYKPRWRGIESSAKHRFSIWQRAEKSWEKRLLRFFLKKKKIKKFASHISLHPFCPSSFVPSSLSIDLNVTQPWHGFSRLLAERVLYILFLLLRFYTISSATLFSASVSFFFFSQNVFPPLYVHLI